MEALLEWLKQGVPAGQLWLYIAVSLVVLSVYDIIISKLAEVLKIKLNSGKEWPIDKRLFLIELPFGALIEEFFFRLPLVLVICLPGSSSWVIWAAIALSIIFGWMHGNFYCIFAQGVMGFVLCLLFLKCGGLQGMVWQALLIVALVHLLKNWFFIAIDFLNGKKYIEL